MRLDDELAEVERSYQDQRRRLMNEVRDEKERLEREANASLAQRTRQLEEKWKQAEIEIQGHMTTLQEKHGVLKKYNILSKFDCIYLLENICSYILEIFRLN